MHQEHTDEAATVSSTAQRIEKPLISAADVPRSALPTIHIPDHRYVPLAELGTKRAFDETDRKRHIQGTLAEWSAGRYFGQPDSINDEIYDEGGDDGYDLEVRGFKIEVKSARKEATSPRLMVGADRDIRADFYVLVHEVGQCCYQPVGWAPAHWIRSARKTTIRNRYYPSKVRVLEQDELLPFPTFTNLG